MIISHISGDKWNRKPSTEIISIDNADMSDRSVKDAYHTLAKAGCENINVVMEDTQSSEDASTRYTHAYSYNENGDIEIHVYDDSPAKQHEEMYGEYVEPYNDKWD